MTIFIYPYFPTKDVYWILNCYYIIVILRTITIILFKQYYNILCQVQIKK